MESSTTATTASPPNRTSARTDPCSGGDDPFSATMHTLRTLLASPSRAGGGATTTATTTDATAPSVTVLAVRVLQSQLDKAHEGQQRVMAELEEERQTRMEMEQTHQATVTELQSQIEAIQETLAQEISLRKSLETALAERETEHQAEVKAVEHARQKAVQDLQQKLIGSAKAIDEERARRLLKEKELEEMKLQQQKQQHDTPAKKKSPPPLFGTPKRQTGSTPDPATMSPAGISGSPANVPLLQDRLMRLARERDGLVQKHQAERQEYLQKIDEALEENQNILAQRDALQAQLDGISQTMKRQQGEGTVVATDDEVQKYKHKLGVVEQKYASLVADLKRQLAKVLADSGNDDKIDNNVYPEDDSSLETEMESLKQMVEILVDDLRRTKQELASTQQLNQGGKGSPYHSSVNPTSEQEEAMQDWKGTVEALQADNESLEEELYSVRQENEELAQQIHVMRERLTQTEIDLEDAAFELSQFDNQRQLWGGIGERGGPGEQESEENCDNDDDPSVDQSTETEDEDRDMADDSEEDGSGSDVSVDVEDEEEISRGDPDVIDLSGSPPRSKRQRHDEESTYFDDV